MTTEDVSEMTHSLIDLIWYFNRQTCNRPVFVPLPHSPPGLEFDGSQEQ
jgi:hypothetical protein